MNYNIGKIDRAIRILLALAFISLRYFDILKGDWADISLVVATILVFTALKRCSPLYSLLGFGTCGIAKPSKSKKPVIHIKPYKG